MACVHVKVGPGVHYCATHEAVVIDPERLHKASRIPSSLFIEGAAVVAAARAFYQTFPNLKVRAFLIGGHAKCD